MTTHKENAASELAHSKTANELKTGSHTSYTAGHITQGGEIQ